MIFNKIFISSFLTAILVTAIPAPKASLHSQHSKAKVSTRDDYPFYFENEKFYPNKPSIKGAVNTRDAGNDYNDYGDSYNTYNTYDVNAEVDPLIQHGKTKAQTRDDYPFYFENDKFDLHKPSTKATVNTHDVAHTTAIEAEIVET